MFTNPANFIPNQPLPTFDAPFQCPAGQRIVSVIYRAADTTIGMTECVDVVTENGPNQEASYLCGAPVAMQYRPAGVAYHPAFRYFSTLTISGGQVLNLFLCDGPIPAS